MTRRYYCPYKILQKYLQGCLCTRISGSSYTSGNGFCFADVLLGRHRVSRAALGDADASGKSGRFTDSSVEWELQFENFPRCDSQTQLRILHGLLETFFFKVFWFFFNLRNKLPLLPRRVRFPGFPFRFWGWSWVKTCLCWPGTALE